MEGSLAWLAALRIARKAGDNKERPKTIRRAIARRRGVTFI
jgi:hypothetical protein